MVMSAPLREGSRLDDLAAVPGAAPGQPVIATERFTLRPLRASDAGMIAHYTADRRVAEGTRAIPHPLPPGASDSFVARALAVLSGRSFVTPEDVKAVAVPALAHRLTLTPQTWATGMQPADVVEVQLRQTPGPAVVRRSG